MIDRPPLPRRDCKRGHYHEPTEKYWYWHSDKRKRRSGYWVCYRCKRDSMDRWYMNESSLTRIERSLRERHYKALKRMAARHAARELWRSEW